MEHWEKIHGPLFMSKNVPGLRKYIQNYPVKGAGPEFNINIDIDGIPEFWFDDAESAVAFYRWVRSSDEAKDLREDSKLYVEDDANSLVFIVEEQVMKE